MLVKLLCDLDLKKQKQNILNMKILDFIKQSDAVQSLFQQKEGHFIVEDVLSLSFTIAACFRENPRKIAVIAPNLYQAQEIYEQISSLIGEENVLFYPLDEVIRIDRLSSSKEMLAQRLFVMEESLASEPKILITHVTAALRYLPEQKLLKSNTVLLKKEEKYNLFDLSKKLLEIGFRKVSKIDQSLQFAQRGDILDIFPINYNEPYRLEFFDDELESIRKLDIASQMSQETDLKEILIFPATELLYEKEYMNQLEEIVSTEFNEETKNIDKMVQDTLRKKINRDLEKIKESGFDDTTYPYFTLLSDKKELILDYFRPERTILHRKEKIEDSFEWCKKELKDYFYELFQNGMSLYKNTYFANLSVLEQYHPLWTYPFATSEKDYSLNLRSIPYVANNIHQSLEMIKRYQKDKKNICIAMDQKNLTVYEEFLKTESIPYVFSDDGEFSSSSITLLPFSFQEGFELKDQNIVVLTEKELFGKKLLHSRYLSRYKKAEVLTTYEDLSPGDYVVHEENGIGQFQSIETLDVGNGPRDYLKIQYAGTGVLYLPLEQFHFIRKFVGKEGAIPKLSRLGGSEWKKSKARMKDKISDIADRLIALYAERENIPGIAFEKDDELQHIFENAFPYTLTSDQIRSVEEIKLDMQRAFPMDRLLCGDVGFGKTEVAFRAAFKAILSHKQVMILCPTTLLARQHYEVAYYRFSPFGVKIAVFSRLISDKKQKEQMEGIKKGEIQLIIGTHRLLSKDIEVPNLGLLIVDEEQRFGVEHKERIKEISKNIDVLTLTATPIPRTLQMSLVGIRSLSTIDIPPQNRMPIQTYVMPYSEKLIIQVIERELSREGQVFYLHNRVSTIYSTAQKLQRLLPRASIGVVHGKMSKEEIDDIMMAFYQNEIQVLVCTSIIETGLDIPNANTIIVENADLFGLSQLYQIKGRVGRSSRVAYAYLLIREDKELNPLAAKRLKAIQDFTELGSGYKIAQRDLNIRGAGDILGSEQSGFIDTVGMDMYLRILREVMNEKKGIKEKIERAPVLPLSFGGYIPKNYAEDKDKIQIYQEIDSVSSIKDLEILRRKLRDIYGKLPKEVLSVLKKRELDILAISPLIESVTEEQLIRVTLTKEANKIPKIATRLSQDFISDFERIGASYDNGRIVIRIIKSSQAFDDLEKVLKVIELYREEQDAVR